MKKLMMTSLFLLSIQAQAFEERIVTGVGSVSIGFSAERYQDREAAKRASENDASDQCGCGTLADYDCMERVSDWRLAIKQDRYRFPTTLLSVATAEFKCINY